MIQVCILRSLLTSVVAMRNSNSTYLRDPNCIYRRLLYAVIYFSTVNQLTIYINEVFFKHYKIENNIKINRELLILSKAYKAWTK